MMKSVIINPAAYYLTCPHCEADIPETRTGSQMWQSQDLAGHFPRLQCPGCGEWLRIPKRLIAGGEVA